MTTPTTPTLLDRALATNKSQWRTCEHVYIWGDQKRGAYLEACDGFVKLFITGFGPSCAIFFLDDEITGGWQVLKDVQTRYDAWVKKFQEARS